MTVGVSRVTNQSEFEAISCSWRQAREDAYEKDMICFVFVPHWLKKRRVLATNQRAQEAKPKKTRTFQ